MAPLQHFKDMTPSIEMTTYRISGHSLYLIFTLLSSSGKRTLTENAYYAKRPINYPSSSLEVGSNYTFSTSVDQHFLI